MNIKQKNIATTVLWAAVFIIVGLLLLGRNTGLIPCNVFYMLVNWQMLLIVLGIDQFIRWNTAVGITLLVLGVVFWIPEFTTVTPWNFSILWPVIFIVIGVGFLIKLLRPSKAGKPTSSSQSFENGQLFINNAFAKASFTATASVFKGGSVTNSFGLTIVDLRAAKLEDAQVFLNTDTSFGQIIVKVPPMWVVRPTLSNNLANFNDTRPANGFERDNAHELILTGSASFGAIEIS